MTGLLGPEHATIYVTFKEARRRALKPENLYWEYPTTKQVSLKSYTYVHKYIILHVQEAVK